MTTTVLVRNEMGDDTSEKCACAKVVQKHGKTEAYTLKAGEEREFHVYDGQAVIIEEMSLAEPEPDAVTLTDEVAVEDGAA